MIKLSIKKPLTVFVAVIAILVLGVVAFLKMTPDLLPNMDFPYVIIMTTYPGASPETVEEEVTRPLEQSMSLLEHIKNVSSTSSENYSLVTLEFEESVNLDTIGVDIAQSITTLESGWDDMVGSPYVLKINPSMLPVAVASVAYEGKDTYELTDFMDETLMTKLESIPGVARISTSGMVEEELHIVLDQKKINKTNATIQEAVNKKLDEAAEELEEKRSELEEAKEKLDDAKEALSSGGSTLANQTAQGESQINQNRNQLLSTRAELKDQLAALADAKTQVETVLSLLTPIRDGIDQIETGAAAARSELAILEAYKQSESAMADFEEQLAAIDADATLTDEEKVAKKEEVTASPAYVTAVATHESNKAAIAALGVSPEGVDQAIIEKQLTIAELEGSMFLLEESLEGLGTSLDDLDNTIQETENSLQQIKDGEKAIEEGIAQIDSGMMQLESAAALLSAQKAAGLLELASASAEIASNSAALTTGMTQIEAGFDTIEANRETALDQADLNEILNLEMLTGILTAQSFSMPAGYITEEGVSYMVSVGDPIVTEKELSELVLLDMGMDGVEPVRLSDVAEIFRTDNAADTYAKLGIEDSLMLTFEKQSNYATAEVTDNIEARFDELEGEYDGLHFVSLMNQGDYIYLIVNSILKSLGLGALFSVIILFIFLKDLRPTVITLCSIPISVIFAIVLMYFSGVTLNMISLSGLAVSVGMLVDNSVVVIENIYRLRSKGISAIKAAASGASQVAGAVTASTLTTVCVFLPIVFVEGITRQLFTDLALTMGYSLMASLIVSLTLVPAMASGMMKKDKQTRDFVLPVLLRGYKKALTWCLKHKTITLLSALVLLIVSGVLVLVRGFSFMPTVEMPNVTASLVMPEECTMEEAVEYSDTVLERMQDIEEIETVGAMMSSGTSLLSLGSSGGSVDVTLYITLKDEKPFDTEMTKKLEALAEDLPCTMSISTSMMDISMLTGSGVAVNLYSTDHDALMKAAETLATAMEGVNGIDEVTNGLEDAVPAVHIAVDRNKAMSKGITVAQIFMELSGVLPESTTGSSMTLDGETLGIILEKQEEKVLELSDLKDYTFSVTKQDGTTVEFPLSDIADIEETTSLPSISRNNQRQLLTVTGTLEEGHNVTLVSGDVEKLLPTLDLGAGVSYDMGGENEAIMEAIEQLLLMLFLGVILVYLIMVAQFQSLKAPFIVLFTIPLAFTGGFVALWIAGLELSVISMIGFIMLVGIIVNNGIVLVDYINQLRLEGIPMQDAIVEAGTTRMRPILMTSITTILGLFDMAFGNAIGTALTAPMALVCIGGLTYATIMTLFIVPCIYAITSKKELRKVDEADLVTVDI